jgi:hypothetical protein
LDNLPYRLILASGLNVIVAARKNYLSRSEIRELLKKGPVQFGMANLGDKLVWEDVAGCYAFFKQEGMDHIVDDFDHIYLDHFKDSYCYLASLWEGGRVDIPLILLEKLH